MTGKKAIGQVVDLSKQFYGDSFSEEAYQQAKNILSDPDSKWSKLINSVLDQTTHPACWTRPTPMWPVLLP